MYPKCTPDYLRESINWFASAQAIFNDAIVLGFEQTLHSFSINHGANS